MPCTMRYNTALKVAGSRNHHFSFSPRLASYYPSIIHTNHKFKKNALPPYGTGKDHFYSLFFRNKRALQASILFGKVFDWFARLDWWGPVGNVGFYGYLQFGLQNRHTSF
ncbi:predicted protein [Sclerotinia sclerotiorum 1980 UF-70]|uniref:Uncharacterized protein n=1 Tax=Sclerotinia sclerotiorum (strain ATCC 18683 / 1980 / Ss-1) TaxID=665079 RepID=A7EN06_SCLS1|nr:predicted protein [Sclerotinia sclerotiorum 1980 UF-70]EDO04222.1 predicted protein [Sclerotinia sclerotiorum 1980 UF-70]